MRHERMAEYERRQQYERRERKAVADQAWKRRHDAVLAAADRRIEELRRELRALGEDV
jgi:hypothetical protein